MSTDNILKRGQLWPLIFFGILSVVFAEVFSGASPLWFINGGFILVVPLYSTHAILLLNLALRFRRTNLTQLYLWGVIFGLYESWITKVIWAGYMNEPGPAFGSFLGFAIPEFFVIALFWHAVFSFIVPILIYEVFVLSVSSDSEERIIPSHVEFVTNTRRNKILFGLIFIIGTLFARAGLADIESVLISSIGNVLILLFLAYLAKKRTKGDMSINSLILGRKGMIITGVALVIQYILLSIILLPERFADATTILLTIMFYGLVIGLLYVSPVDVGQIEQRSGDKTFNWNTVQKWFGVYIVLILFWSFLTELALVALTMLYLAMIVVGPVLFLFAIYRIAREKLSKS